jgi:mono/diheme cytochrome c family protein
MPAEYFYPKQVIMDMAFSLLLMAGLGFLAYFHPVGLGPIANPADTHFLPRPEWYYLPMFEWLKFWEGPKVVFAVVVVPGLLAAGFFLMPFLDRGLERKPWRRPIPVLAVAIVMVGIVYLGVRSEMDDRRDPSIAAQLKIQDQQEKAYSAAPFEPYIESPGGTGPSALPTGPVSPLVARGRGIFQEHGCSGCHGEVGLGGVVGPNLTGITTKFPEPQLIDLLHHPNAAMLAGKMPAVDVSADDMKALLAYLAVIGTPSANVQASFSNSSPSSAAGGPAQAASGAASGAMAGVAPNAPTAPGVPAPSAAATAGAQVYLEHGCIGCHGPAGSGGRAPALAPMIASLSDAQLANLITHPNAKMIKGGMPPFFGPPEQLTHLVAYLRTLHPPVHGAAPEAPTAQPLQSSVRYPDMGAATGTAAETAPAASAPSQTPVAAPPSPEAAAMPGHEYFQNLGCVACHGAYGQGTHFAPSLLNVGTKFPGDKLPDLLHHPTAKMRAGGMPLVTLQGQPLQQLVDYLRSLKPATVAAAKAAAAKSQVAARTAPYTASGAPQPATAPRPVWKASALPALAQQGRRIFQLNRCETCHGVDGLHGTVAAPPLAGTASLLPADTLESLLRHHTTRMQRGGMPLTNMNPADMKALITFIRAMPSDSSGQ